jgi:hypothetical protein
MLGIILSTDALGRSLSRWSNGDDVGRSGLTYSKKPLYKKYSSCDGDECVLHDIAGPLMTINSRGPNQGPGGTKPA